MVKPSPIQPVILCGGVGTRLWPLSRPDTPKQFLNLGGSHSLLQQTILRLKDIQDGEMILANPLIVAGEDHRFLLLEQLRTIGVESPQIILEPEGRNTAPALTLAAFAANDNHDPVLIVSPADHAIGHTESFINSLRLAVKLAQNDEIVIIGVKPTRAETGYGYIEAKPREGKGELVIRFVEKPDEKTAQIYCDSGNYFWNAGIFVLKSSQWLRAIKRFKPDIYQATQESWSGRAADSYFTYPSKINFLTNTSVSIDYAVMEHADPQEFPLIMVGLQASWSDLGSWESVWQNLAKDEQGNVSQGDVWLNDSHDNFIKSSHRLVGVVGISHAIIVETPDALLVADKSKSQRVKNLVSELEKAKRSEYSGHRKVHRPWGWYDTIEEGPNFKVKRIQVNPNASLSLQKHAHRAEHWVVVSGRAEITKGTQIFQLGENQSTYIEVGEIHRLANPGTEPLEIIEVQTGSYLGEDDIHRFDDHYGRE